MLSVSFFYLLFYINFISSPTPNLVLTPRHPDAKIYLTSSFRCTSFTVNSSLSYFDPQYVRPYYVFFFSHHFFGIPPYTTTLIQLCLSSPTSFDSHYISLLVVIVYLEGSLRPKIHVNSEFQVQIYSSTSLQGLYMIIPLFINTSQRVRFPVFSLSLLYMIFFGFYPPDDFRVPQSFPKFSLNPTWDRNLPFQICLSPFLSTMQFILSFVFVRLYLYPYCLVELIHSPTISLCQFQSFLSIKPGGFCVIKIPLKMESYPQLGMEYV